MSATITRAGGTQRPDRARPGVIGPQERDAEAARLIRELLTVLGEDPDRPGLRDTPLRAARALREQSPGLVFCYVSGQGTDSSEKGRAMWARVKGKTENDLLATCAPAYMFRPGYIHPVKGVVSSTRLYRVSAHARQTVESCPPENRTRALSADGPLMTLLSNCTKFLQRGSESTYNGR